MTHLSEAEFVDLIDETLAPARMAHLDTCAACREQATALDAGRRAASAVEMPEPSPLFWDHLQARVRAAIDAEPQPAASRWSWGGFRVLVPAAAAALLVAVLSGVVPRVHDGTRDEPSTARPAASHGAVAPDPGVDGTFDPADADVWDVLTSAASIDEANGAGMRAQPAAVDHAVQRLSSAELTELGRLLQAELKRSSN